MMQDLGRVDEKRTAPLKPFLSPLACEDGFETGFEN